MLNPWFTYIYVKLKNTDLTKYLKDSDDKLPKLGPYKYSKGEVYEGEYKSGKRHGEGKQIWSDSTYYQGTWSNDMADGYGF